MMQIDTFTKIILTVIAINLTILTAQSLDLIPELRANEPTAHTGLNTLAGYGLVPVNSDGTISVK